MGLDLKDVGVLGTLLSQAVPLIKKVRESNLSGQHKSELDTLTDIVSDTSGRLFALQATLLSLQQENAELGAQIARMKAWDTEKQRYRLATPFPGCMVYALQRSASNGDPAHYLCTSCFQRGDKSIFQGRIPVYPKSGEGMAYAQYYCSVCKTEAVTPWMNVVAPEYFEDIGQKK